MGLTEVTAVVGSALCLWGATGLLPHLFRPERRAAFWLALTIVFLLGQGALRTLWWDGLDLFWGVDQARDFRRAAGGRSVNWVPNLILIGAGYALLRLLHLLIPEEDRHRYSPLTAPIYPAPPGFGALIVYLRELWRQRRR